MLHDTAVVLFESTDAKSVLSDPVNADWLAVVRGVDGERYYDVELRYYVALKHFRASESRRLLPGQIEIEAEGKALALQGMLKAMEERKGTEKQNASQDGPAIFIDPRADISDDTLPESLADFSVSPPALHVLLSGRGRPPIDALCVMRAFLGASALGLEDTPTGVHTLLRSNPTFARSCGFGGRDASTPQGELTSRALPSLSKLEEFSEVMTRYGLWRLLSVRQVEENLREGVVEIEDTLAFDTTHIKANSHCANVVPEGTTTPGDKASKKRKVPRMRKGCSCGKKNWEQCKHPWVPTDQGAGIVVKGPTRVYWAHKASVVSMGSSGIPIDARVLQYASEHDGKTLVPHLHLLQHDHPNVVSVLRHVLADDAYQGNHKAVLAFGRGALLHVPVHPSGRSNIHVAGRFPGIVRFTPLGVPICLAGVAFEMLGRDLSQQRFIWAAPCDDEGSYACAGCPFAADCGLTGARRHIRVDRDEFTQIDWDNPQHLARNRKRYQMRTGVERAIKRLKVDLQGEYLTHRNSPRVQAHMDRKMLVLHLLLAARSEPG